MPMLATESIRLNYHTLGGGEVVVLIHGLGANMAFWFLNIATTLAQRYRVVTYDLRGHGRSDAPAYGYRLEQMVEDLNALLDHLGIASAHLVGHSFGGRVALCETILHTSRVQSLTIADSQLACLQPRMRLRDWYHWPVWKRQLEKQGLTSLPDDDEFISYHLLAGFNQFGTSIANGEIAEGQHRARPSLRTRDMGHRGSIMWARLLETTSAGHEFEDEAPLSEQGISAIRVPTCAIFGEYSHCLPTGRALTRLIPGCRLVQLPRAGHFHPAVRPRLFTRVLRAFLAQHSN